MRYQSLLLEDHRVLGEKCLRLEAGLDRLLVDVIHMEWRPGGRKTLRTIKVSEKLRCKLDTLYYRIVPQPPFPPSPYYGVRLEMAPELSSSVLTYVIGLGMLCEEILQTMKGRVPPNVLEIGVELMKSMNLLKETWLGNGDVAIDESC